MDTLFNGKLNVEISVYNPGKSVAISVEGLSHPVYCSIKNAYRYTGEKIASKATKVNKKATVIKEDVVTKKIDKTTKSGKKSNDISKLEKEIAELKALAKSMK